MEHSFEEMVRHIAKNLAPEFDRSFPVFVEARLQADEEPLQRFDAGTTIALAALLVSVAQFAWDIYRDQKKENKKVTSDFISRQIRLEFRLKEGISEKQRDRIISAVVTEIESRSGNNM